LSISALASLTYSSNAAIIRLCRKVGCDGYKDFRIALAQEVEKDKRKKKKIDVNYPFASKENAGTIMRSVADISREAIDTALESVSPYALEKAASLIRNANCVHIYATGDTQISAIAFSNMLSKLGILTINALEYHESMSYVYTARDNDVALFVTYSGEIMKHLRQQIRELRKRNVKTILISSLESYPWIDVVVTIPARENAVGKTAGYYSQALLRYVMNCIYGIIYSWDLNANRQRKDDSDQAAVDIAK
ncbi:MAG: MurR/RpiR family transcriptional regulator, partial [Erysipelotrichaceae bacterium]|nr:MurR/RpiR family transcriptional regulator [Erysipelotrichaceae bacterium]